jgi:uncharacterized membrane protein
MTNVQRSASRQRIMADALLWSLMLFMGALLAWLSVARYAGYNVGMLDLGNMSQAIGSVLRGQPLVYTAASGPTSRLAVHVELIYFLIAPLYAVWPDPRALLIVQALLFALGALPAYAMALRRTDSRFAARSIALIYLLYPTALTSVLFDFHGDTLALPLLMFALDALDQRAWRRYAVFVTLALLCKVYVAVAVALLGVLLWRMCGMRRAGLLTMAAGLGYGALAFFVIRPLFATADMVETQRGLSYVTFYFGRMHEILDTLGDRALSAVIVFGPALFVAWRGWRWLLPGLVIAAAALLSTGPGGSYDYRYHHYATVVPFIIMATIDGVDRLRQSSQAHGPNRNRPRRNWRGDLGLTLAIVCIFFVLLVDTPFNPLFWIGAPAIGRDASAYGVIARDAVKDRFLQAHVPDGSPIAASNQLAPHLTNRETLYLLRYPDETEPRRLPEHLAHVDYAVADALFDYYVPLADGHAGGLDGGRAAIALLLRHPDFGLVAERDGLLLFQRHAPAERAMTAALALLPDDGAPAEQQFGEQIGLVRHSFEQLSPDRLRVRFVWRLSGDVSQIAQVVAVSRLEGVPNMRFVHLPTYALLPGSAWQPGQLVQETFDVDVADVQPGAYVWRTGWYYVGLPASYATDARSRLPGSEEVAVATLAIAKER